MASNVEPVAHAEAVRTGRGRILTTLIDRLESLSASGTEAIFSETPAYAAWRDETPGRREERHNDVLHHVRLHYQTLLLSLLEERSVTLDDIDFVRAAAVRRARAGIAVEHFLNAFRVGQQVLWEAILDASSEIQAGREAALSLATPLLKYIHFASTQAAQAYTAFQQSALADGDRDRRDLLELVLDGRLPSEGPVHDAARQYGIGANERMFAVVAVPTDPNLDVEAMHDAGSKLEQAFRSPTRTLVVLRYDEIVAVPVLAAGGDANALCAQVIAVERQLSAAAIALAIGVSTEATGVSGLPRAYQEARSALETLAGRAGVVALPQLAPLDYFILRSDETTHRLVNPELRSFLSEDARRGGSLSKTIEAFASANMKLRETATSLHIHPHTAQYRLQRIHERTGRNPRQVADLLELLVALALERGRPQTPAEA